MTDQEITKLCAGAMGITLRYSAQGEPYFSEGDYRPLQDDAQAMALVKTFYLDIYYLMPFNDGDPWSWRVRGTIEGWEKTEGQDLNRCICECVAKMQGANP